MARPQFERMQWDLDRSKEHWDRGDRAGAIAHMRVLAGVAYAESEFTEVDEPEVVNG